jgi:hypothetical protein
MAEVGGGERWGWPIGNAVWANGPIVSTTTAGLLFANSGMTASTEPATTIRESPPIFSAGSRRRVASCPTSTGDTCRATSSAAIARPDRPVAPRTQISFICHPSLLL